MMGKIVSAAVTMSLLTGCGECHFDSCGFTWQVFATLFVGLVAAGGATTIGIFQVKIARRQADIAAGQKDIADAQRETAQASLKVTEQQANNASAAVKIADAQALTARLAQRASLFERRFKVYEVTRDYASVAMNRDETALMGKFEEMREGLHMSRFLFPPSVQQELEKTIDLAEECSMAMAERSPDKAKDIRDLRKALRTSLQSLADRMGR